MSKPEMFFIKPVGGAKVRDPHTTMHLANEGEFKPRTAFWVRRIADGDVVQAKQPKSTRVAGDK